MYVCICELFILYIIVLYIKTVLYVHTCVCVYTSSVYIVLHVCRRDTYARVCVCTHTLSHCQWWFVGTYAHTYVCVGV
jgi:hypothetical protein